MGRRAQRIAAYKTELTEVREELIGWPDAVAFVKRVTTFLESWNLAEV